MTFASAAMTDLHRSLSRRRSAPALLALLLVLLAAPPARAIVTPFGARVNAAIDKGLDYVRATADSAGGWGTMSWGAGLCDLALLERRPPLDWNSPQMGYDGSPAADQTRMRNGAKYIVNTTWGNGYYSYGYGQFEMALALYRGTGGPNDVGAGHNVDDTLRRMIQLATANQQADGAWCYNSPGCDDNSTTQFSAAGLGALERFDAHAHDGAWPKLTNYLTSIQNGDGGYGYRSGFASSTRSPARGSGCSAWSA